VRRACHDALYGAWRGSATSTWSRSILCARACARACMRACARACLRARVRVCARVCARACVCARVCACVRVRVCARACASAHVAPALCSQQCMRGLFLCELDRHRALERRSNVAQRVAMQCILLQRRASCCSAVHLVAAQCHMLQRSATCCTVAYAGMPLHWSAPTPPSGKPALRIGVALRA
jgi:hypothetical protein